MTEAVPAAGEPVQQMFGGMPTRLYAASPSRLLAWLDCPRRYRMTYLDRPRPAARPPRAHTSIGVATHNALRDYWDLAPADRSAAAAPGLVRRAWVDAGFRDPEQSVRWRARVVAQVSHYLEGVDPHEAPLGTERTVSLRTTTPAPRFRSPSTPSPPRGCSVPAAPGSSCTTCRAARWPCTPTPRSRWTASWPRPSRSPPTCAGPTPTSPSVARSPPGSPRAP